MIRRSFLKAAGFLLAVPSALLAEPQKKIERKNPIEQSIKDKCYRGFPHMPVGEKDGAITCMRCTKKLPPSLVSDRIKKCDHKTRRGYDLSVNYYLCECGLFFTRQAPGQKDFTE